MLVLPQKFIISGPGKHTCDQSDEKNSSNDSEWRSCTKSGDSSKSLADNPFSLSIASSHPFSAISPSTSNALFAAPRFADRFCRKSIALLNAEIGPAASIPLRVLMWGTKWHMDSTTHSTALRPKGIRLAVVFMKAITASMVFVASSMQISEPLGSVAKVCCHDWRINKRRRLNRYCKFSKLIFLTGTSVTKGRSKEDTQYSIKVIKFRSAKKVCGNSPHVQRAVSESGLRILLRSHILKL